MSDYTIKIHNVETDEVIERDMTSEEIEMREAENLALAEEAKAIAAQKAARQAILDRLGLTEEEARLLLG